MNLFDDSEVKKSRHVLSKTTYVSGMQCHKMLYLIKFKPEVRTPPSVEKLQLFKKGRNFEAEFKAIFPEGKDITKVAGKFDKYESTTQQLVESFDEITLFEATFQHNGVLIMVDVFRKHKEGYFEAFEVKSSKTMNVGISNDLALQYSVLKAIFGQNIRFFAVLRNADHTPNVIAMNDELEPTLAATQAHIEELFQVCKSVDEPAISTGEHCTKPYACDFQEYCNR